MQSNRILSLIVCVYLISCGVEYKAPDLGNLYTRPAMESHRYSNPVIVIPGNLDSNHLLYGQMSRFFFRPSRYYEGPCIHR